jgi:hypothetical protein
LGYDGFVLVQLATCEPFPRFGELRLRWITGYAFRKDATGEHRLGCRYHLAIKTGTTCADDQDFECCPVFKYYLDDLSSSENELPKNSLLALVTEFQIVRTAGKYNVHRRLAGLVLTPGAESGT